MFNIGPLELMVILIIALLVVGPSRLPDVGRSIGRGLREFRRAQEEVQRTLRLSLDEDDEPPSRPMRGLAPADDGNAHVERPAPRVSGLPDAGAAEGAAAPREGEEVAKTIGRGLAELRRAKEELHNAFRLDLGDGDGGRGSG